jgi:hypothetical protein
VDEGPEDASSSATKVKVVKEHELPRNAEFFRNTGKCHLYCDCPPLSRTQGAGGRGRRSLVVELRLA